MSRKNGNRFRRPNVIEAGRDARRFLVFVDGNQVKHCVKVNFRRGFAVVMEYPLRIVGDEIVTRKIRGKVKMIEVKDA